MSLQRQEIIEVPDNLRDKHLKFRIKKFTRTLTYLDIALKRLEEEIEVVREKGIAQNEKEKNS